MEYKSKVSVLVTYYNQEQYVEQSIRSIININFPCEYEILVGDDGSSDDTWKTIQRYVEMYPTKIKAFKQTREDNIRYDSVIRASALRKKLLEEAEGDYYCIIDGDDWYCDRDFITDAIREFDMSDDISIVAFSYVLFGGEMDGKVYPSKLKKGIVNTKSYIRNNYVHSGSCVFRRYHCRKYIEKIKECIYFDDNDIVFNNLSYGHMLYISRPVYCYRQTDESIYHKMGDIRRCILNCLGYDSSVYYISHDADMIARYIYSIIVILIAHKEIFSLLEDGEGKMLQKEAMSFESSLTAELFGWQRSNVGGVNRKIKILFAALLKPKAAVSGFIRALNIKKKIISDQ